MDLVDIRTCKKCREFNVQNLYHVGMSKQSSKGIKSGGKEHMYSNERISNAYTVKLEVLLV